MTVGFAIATIFFSNTKIIEFRIRTIQFTVSKEQPFWHGGGYVAFYQDFVVGPAPDIIARFNGKHFQRQWSEYFFATTLFPSRFRQIFELFSFSNIQADVKFSF